MYLKDENKLNEMVDILDELHKYVPMVKTTEVYETAGPSGCMETAEINMCHFHHILMTVARVRGSQDSRYNSVAVRIHAITLTMEGDVKKGSYLLLQIGIQKCVQ